MLKTTYPPLLKGLVPLLIGVLGSASIAAQPAALKVRVAQVERAPLTETLPLSGTLVSPKASNLSARLSGIVETLYVDAGSRVQEGDALLALDQKLALLELQRLEGALKQAEILFQDAVRRVNEARELTSNNNISRTEFDARVAQADADEASVVQLRAQLAAQQEQLDRHVLKAPFAGVIARKLTEEGEWVNSDAAVLELVQMDPLFLDVRVPERYTGRIQAGGSMAFSTGAQPSQQSQIAIQSVVPVSDPATRTFLVRAQLANGEWVLQPGMSVKAELALLQPDMPDVLQLSADAVVRKPDGSNLVWVVRPGTKDGASAEVAQPVPVQLGRSAGSQLEVQSAELAPGDRVVVLGNENLKTGQAVSVQP